MTTLPYYRLSDADLLIWSSDFSKQLTTSPATYQVTVAQANEYSVANAAFESAMAAWRNNATRTPVASATKKEARETLLSVARYLVNTINSNPAITDAQRETLGIRAREEPKPTELLLGAWILLS